LIGPKTRAIVLISPNNPTGRGLPRQAIHAFYELAQRRGIALLLDENLQGLPARRDAAARAVQ